jgi:hypothetical protein
MVDFANPAVFPVQDVGGVGGQAANVQAHDARGDGVTNDRAAFVAADALDGPNLVPAADDAYLIATSLTITAARTRFEPGGVIRPAAAQVVTFPANGIEAGHYPIFDLSLGGSIAFSGPTEIKPEWWGAINRTNLEAAWSAVGAVGGEMRLDSGKDYTFTRLLLGTPTAPVVIDGNNAQFIATDATNSAIELEAADGVKIKNLRVKHQTPISRIYVAHGIYLIDCTNFEIENVEVDTPGCIGMYLHGCTHGLLSNIRISNTLADGLHITGGSKYIRGVNIISEDVGDDGVAVVSYLSSGLCEDISIENIRVARSLARGVTVVGGKDIKYTNVTTEDTKASSVYIAREGAFSTYGVDDVQITNVHAVRPCNYLGSVSVHGALTIACDDAAYTVRNIRIRGMNVRGARHKGFLIGTIALGVYDVDVDGFDIDGTEESTGIALLYAGNVRLANGIVRQSWTGGVLTDTNCGRVLVENVTVEDCNESLTANTYGFQLRSDDGHLRDCVVIDPSAQLALGWVLNESDGGTVTNSDHGGRLGVYPPPGYASGGVYLASAKPTTGTTVTTGDRFVDTSPLGYQPVAWVALSSGDAGTANRVVPTQYAALSFGGGPSTITVAAGVQSSTTVALGGVAVGDTVSPIALSVPSQGMQVWGHIEAAGVITIYFYNGTAGSITLTSFTFKGDVRKIP